MSSLKPFDHLGQFRASNAGLRRQAVRGAGAMLVSSGLGLAIQIVSTVVLARLLTPEDFGLVTMVLTFSLLVSNCGFNGFTEAIIQRENLNHSLASNIFWINLGLCVLLTGVFASMGQFLSRFYHDPRIAHVTVGVSLTILLNGAWVVHVALLNRAMRFGAVSTNDLVARTVAIGVSVLLAWYGWRYWALVGGVVAIPLVTSIGAWILCPWIPGRPTRVTETESMVRFAINVYSRFSVNYCARNLDSFLVGWRFNAQSLGFYKKAYDLFALTAGQIVSPLTNVAVSALSRVRQNPVEYRRYLLNALGTVAFIAMGVGANLTLVGKDVILVLLGPNWGTSGRVFTYFGLGIGIMVIYATHGWIHLSIGRADRWLRWGIVEFGITASLFLIALPWGPIGIAVAWSTSFWILTIPALWYAGKPIEIPIASIIKALWKYVVAAAAAGGMSAVVFGSTLGSQTTTSALIRIITVSVQFGAFYLVTVTLLHRSLLPVFNLGRLLKEMLPFRNTRESSISPSPQLVKTAESRVD